ncbi:MAG: ribitol-5-phosphate dehydrogenase [Eubacteriales bacterium]|nr:ribitol-5-phosphate dehydrogenase [Eubacteriales bacterium]
MLNTVYQLKAPRQFEVAFKDIELDQEHVIVRPTHLSICHADQRYYQGTRPEEILRQKLPMALIHEGIGTVVMDPTGSFRQGDHVVMIPNAPVERDEIIAENYLRSSKFCASSKDGFMQEYVSLLPDRLVLLPEGINPIVAAFTEIVSVSYHAVSRFRRFAHSRRDVIGVWGDGNLGYITSLLLKKLLPDSRVLVFGRNHSKLNDFSFADETYLVSEIPSELTIDHAFECVGGMASSKAVNQIIDHIVPEGTIALLGVSEDEVPINTRMVLEKGLHLYGSSRSGREDFVGLLKLYEENPDIVSYLENIVGSQFEVHTIADLVNAFETDIHKLIGKTVMVWKE